MSDANNIDIFTTADVVPIGDPSDASNIDLLNTGTRIVGDVEDATNILDLTPPEDPPLQQVYYDMFGNPYKTQAEANAADAEHLRKQQEAADAEAAAEAERLRMEQLAQLEADAAAEAATAEAERIRIAQQAQANQESGLIGTKLGDPRGDESNVMTNYLPEDPSVTKQRQVVDFLQNTPDELTIPEFDSSLGLGDPNIGKGKTGADSEEEDDRGFYSEIC